MFYFSFSNCFLKHILFQLVAKASVFLLKFDPKSLSSAGKLLYFSLTEHRCQASCHILSGEIQQMDMTAELQFALALTLHIQGVAEMT